MNFLKIKIKSGQELLIVVIKKQLNKWHITHCNMNTEDVVKYCILQIFPEKNLYRSYQKILYIDY